MKLAHPDQAIQYASFLDHKPNETKQKPHISATWQVLPCEMKSEAKRKNYLNIDKNDCETDK